MLKSLLLRFQIKDVSFGNLFWRKLSIRLLILLIVSVCVLYFGQAAVMEISTQQIDAKVTEAALKLVQMGDKDNYNDRFATATNIVLSELHENIKSSPFVVDSSTCFYDLTNKRLVAKSFEIPVVCSNDAIAWWREQTGNNDNVPTVSLTEDALEFCRIYKNYNLYMESAGCINSILCPSAIVAKNNDGKELDRCGMTLPSALETMKLYENQIEIKIIGNLADDAVYDMMSSAVLQVEQNAQSDKTTQVPNGEEQVNGAVNEEARIVYSDGFGAKAIKLITKNFTVNEIKYQIDCGYQVNFWFGAWKLVAAIEVLCLLLCIIGALINTKETLAMCR